MAEGAANTTLYTQHRNTNRKHHNCDILRQGDAGVERQGALRPGLAKNQPLRKDDSP